MNSDIKNIAVQATVKAAIASYPLRGQKDPNAADFAAVTAMRNYLNSVNISAKIVIGEGERDNAPMLYIGEKLGKGGACVDIAVDPLEGTNLLAYNMPGAMSVIGIGPKQSFLEAPDVYMDKIATCVDLKERIIDLEMSVKANLKNIASAKKISISNLIVTVLDRKRHEELIARVKEAGARLKLISDGDVAAVIGTAARFALTDVYMGIGGAPEGVLSAAALQSTSGQMCAKLLFNHFKEEQKGRALGIKDLNKQYFLDDLASKDSIFVASGITGGELLDGVKFFDNEYTVSSLVMHSKIIEVMRSSL